MRITLYNYVHFRFALYKINLNKENIISITIIPLFIKFPMSTLGTSKKFSVIFSIFYHYNYVLMLKNPPNLLYFIQKPPIFIKNSPFLSKPLPKFIENYQNPVTFSSGFSKINYWFHLNNAQNHTVFRWHNSNTSAATLYLFSLPSL